MAYLMRPDLTFSEAIVIAAERRLEIGAISSHLELRRVLGGIKWVSSKGYPEDKCGEFWSHALARGSELFGRTSCGRHLTPADIYRQLKFIPAEIRDRGFEF